MSEGGGDRHEPIVLGRAPAFALGPLKVEPALRRLSRDGEEEFVQPRVIQVLVALARANGEVLTRDDLIESCWAGAIVTDDALNRIVSQVRKLADGIGRDAFTVETVARVGYRMHRHEPEAQPESASSPSRPAPELLGRRRLPRWPWGVAALLAAAVSWWLLRPEPPRLPRLALAPFTVSGAGVPADLPRNLDADLRSALGNDRVEIAGSAAELELGGSIRREGTGLRFTITVARPGGAALRTFSRDVPAGQTTAELVAYLSRFLGCSTGFSRHRGPLPDRPQALMLEYCAKMVAGGPGQRSPGAALDLARAIVRAAPDFANGGALVAEAIDMMPPGQQSPVLIEEARAAARRATELDPGAPFGFLRLAGVLPATEPVERERLLRHAVELTERDGASFLSGFPQQTLGDGLMQSGRLDEAVAMYQRGVDQDRTSPNPSLRLAISRYAQGRTTEADTLIEQNLASTPEVRARQIRAVRAIYSQRWAEAATLVRAPTPEVQAALTEGYAALESRDPARIARAGGALAALPIDLAPEDVVVPMLAQLGAADAVFAALERSRAGGGRYAVPFARPGRAQPLLFDPRLAAIRRDPRFAAHLKRSGFYAYWRATGSRPDECANRGPPPYCAALR